MAVSFWCPGRLTGSRQVRLVLHEAAGVVGLSAAVGEHHGEIGNDDSAEGGYHGEPAEVIDEHNHGDYEAGRADAHHQQVPALPVADVVGQRPPGLRHHVHLRPPSAAGLTRPHPSTVCPRRGPSDTALSASGARASASRRAAAQLAWLTDDMLNPSTRTGGI